MRRSLIPALLFVCYGAWEAQAAEFGNITVHSWLGRQLKASVTLTGDDARQSEARCFKGMLVNLNNEPVASLKVTLQHSVKGTILLLFGGNAVDEPAAMVRVENTCGAGAVREYALLLDQVPEALRSNAPLAANPLPEAGEADMQHGETVRTEVLLSDIVSHSTGMMRLTATLAATQTGGTGRAGLTNVSWTDGADTTPGAEMPQFALKLAHTLGKHAAAGPSRSDQAGGTGTSINRSGMIAGVLSLLTFAGAAAWIVMRLREMRAASKPWMPIDAVLDSEGGQVGAAPAKQESKGSSH